jgi:hypothetical protein
VRALAGLGLVAEEADGRVGLILAGEWCWRTWSRLLHSVRTGEPAFDQIFGMSNFEYWEHNAEAGAIHDAFFTEGARMTTAPLVTAYDFSRFGGIVDVGGSNGPLLAGILKAHPGVRASCSTCRTWWRERRPS